MHRTLMIGFIVGAAMSAALLISLAVGEQLPEWLQLAAAFSLMSAFICLYLAEVYISDLARGMRSLEKTIADLTESHHAATVMADMLLMAQLRTAFRGRRPAGTGPQSLRCAACSSTGCPGIRGVALCPQWQEAQVRHAKDLWLPVKPVRLPEPDAWPLTHDDAAEDTTDDGQDTTP